MASKGAAEALRQILEGADFNTPRGLLRSVRAERAVVVPAGAPYSIATNVAHAEMWQRLWLCRLRGEPLPKIHPGQDFPEVSACTWVVLRQKFVEGLEEAYRIANSTPFVHRASSDEVAVRTLLRIANHGAYHLGQVQLLKRMLSD